MKDFKVRVDESKKEITVTVPTYGNKDIDCRITPFGILRINSNSDSEYFDLIPKIDQSIDLQEYVLHYVNNTERVIVKVNPISRSIEDGVMNIKFSFTEIKSVIIPFIKTDTSVV